MPNASMLLSFTLNSQDDVIALNDLLKTTGICESGGRCKLLISSGQVTVDGFVETHKTAKIRAGQTVQYGACLIKVQTTDIAVA